MTAIISVQAAKAGGRGLWLGASAATQDFEYSSMRQMSSQGGLPKCSSLVLLYPLVTQWRVLPAIGCP